jgi:hypothetical protein
MPAHDRVVVVPSPAAVFFVIVAASLTVGCPASTERPDVGTDAAGTEDAADAANTAALQADVIKEFQAYVDAANHCEIASDCVGITPGVPAALHGGGSRRSEDRRRSQGARTT